MPPSWLFIVTFTTAERVFLKNKTVTILAFIGPFGLACGQSERAKGVYKITLPPPINSPSNLKQLNSYLYLVKAVAAMLLIAVFCFNAVPFLEWLQDDDAPSIELCDPVDNESDDEKKKFEEEADDEFQMPATWAAYFSSTAAWKIFLTADYSSLYHLEIHTPPPESVVFLS